MSMKILVVEDNQDMRNGLVQFLSHQGFAVSGVANCEDGIDAVDENTYDAAIIDINLPGKSGFSLIEYIRDQGYKFPMIAMTARDGVEDKVKGFELGLTDYIVKPFDHKELLARLNAHLKVFDDRRSDVIKTRNYMLNPEGFEFQKQGTVIELTQIEMRIMQALMRSHRSLVSLDDLIDFAWGESPDMTRPPVRIHIANLRKKIGDTDYRTIRTIPGTGYIFNDSDSVGKKGN